MTPFEIIISIGAFGIIVCLGLIIWTLRQSIVKPIQIAKQQAQQAVETEVKQAKIELESYKVETRIEPKVKVSAAQDDFNKLRELRRKE